MDLEEKITEIIYKNSTDIGEGMLIDYKKIPNLIDKIYEAFSLYGVVCSNFKTIITDFETHEVLSTSHKILPLSKDDKLTIKDKYYEVDYCDWNFDKAIFEVCVYET